MWYILLYVNTVLDDGTKWEFGLSFEGRQAWGSRVEGGWVREGILDWLETASGKTTTDGKCRQVSIVFIGDEESSYTRISAVNLSNWFVRNEGNLIELYFMLGICWILSQYTNILYSIHTMCEIDFFFSSHLPDVEVAELTCELRSDQCQNPCFFLVPLMKLCWERNHIKLKLMQYW